MSTQKKKTTEAVKDAEVQERPAETETSGARKVRMARTVCRPEGSFQSGRTYGVSEKLAEAFIKNKFAEEAK